MYINSLRVSTTEFWTKTTEPTHDIVFISQGLFPKSVVSLVDRREMVEMVSTIKWSHNAFGKETKRIKNARN